MVGTTCDAKAQPNHRKDQVQVLGANPQVWSEDPKDRRRGEKVDEENGNTLLWDAICKEMKNVRPAFEAWDKTSRSYCPAIKKSHVI
jgi:hypothetical protein